MDYDVATYTSEELLDLLELPENASLQDIEERCTQYMEKYKTSHPELSKFFLQIRERLMESQDSSSSDSEQESSDSDSSDSEKSVQESPHINHAQATTSHEANLVGKYPLYERNAFYANNPHQFKTDIQQTHPTDIVPGTLNPFFRKSYKKMIVIDSKYRENYFDSNTNDFHISFPEPIKNVINMTVTNVDIINTHYTVSATEGTNYIHMTLIPRLNSFPPYEIPIELEPGNMFSEDMSQKINEQIRLFFANKDKNTTQLFPDDTLSNQFTRDHLVKCEVSTLSGRTIFTVNTDISGIGGGVNEDINFKEMQLDFTNPISEELPPFFSLGWTLGFRNRLYTGARTYKSESIFNAAGRQAVYLAIDDYQNHSNERICLLHQDAFFSKNLIARVPLRDGKFTITFNDMSDRVERTRDYFGPVDLQRFHVQLFDEYGQLFDNNNMDFNFVVEVEVLYQA